VSTSGDWLLEWDPRALADARRLSVENRRRVIAGLERLAETGHGDVVPLRGRDNEWRLRVGAYRVVFSWQHAELKIRIWRVVHRSDAYR
jgi:mRNA interferase RelE/StbE